MLYVRWKTYCREVRSDGSAPPGYEKNPVNRDDPNLGGTPDDLGHKKAMHERIMRTIATRSIFDTGLIKR